MATFLRHLFRSRRPDATPESTPTVSPRTSLTLSRPGSPHVAAARSEAVVLCVSPPLYAWLCEMAAEHNYGSVHKSIRDLLRWAADATDEDDLEWIFASARKGVPTSATRAEPHSKVRARLSARLAAWVRDCVQQYGVDSPSQLLQCVCRAAIDLDAAYDVFASDEAGRALPSASVDLYYDLGIRGLAHHSLPPAHTLIYRHQQRRRPPSPPLPHARCTCVQ